MKPDSDWVSIPGAVTPALPGTEQRMLPVKTIAGQQGKDVRVRVSTSFLNCPGGNPSNPFSFNNVDRLFATADFDLMMCGFDTQECYAASASVYDNNEGFDTMLYNNPSDDLRIFIVSKHEEGELVGACGDGRESLSTHWHWWSQ